MSSDANPTELTGGTPPNQPQRFSASVLILVAGLLTSLLTWSGMGLSQGMLQIPNSAETIRLRDAMDNPENNERAQTLIAENKELNAGVLAAWTFAFTGFFFGAAGTTYLVNTSRGLFAGLLGIILGVPLGFILGPFLARLQVHFTAEFYDPLVVSMLCHGALWGLAISCAAIAIGICSFNLKAFFVCGLTGILGALTGVLVFALITGFVYPHVATNEIRFQGLAPQAVWAICPSMLAAIVMLRGLTAVTR